MLRWMSGHRPCCHCKEFPEVHRFLSDGPLAAILPLLPRRIQLPIPLGLHLLRMPDEHVVWRDIPDGAVQTRVVVIQPIRGFSRLPIYFLLSMEGAPFCCEFEPSTQNLHLGQITAGEVMVAAAHADAAMQKWQICEANYFTGEHALLHHQRATALARLKAARDGCPKEDTDYTEALAELKRLGVPEPLNDEQ